jgi:hypothetical protein
MTLARFKGIVFLVVGAGLLGVGIWMAVGTSGFLRHALAAEGTVIATPHGGAHPQVRFTTAAGQVVEYSQNGYVSGYHVGDRVRVLHDPSQPSNTACFDGFGALWGMSIQVFAMGLVFAVAGTIILRSDRRPV